MKVRIYGSGCSSCRKLEENVREALSLAKIDAEIEKVQDINQIVAKGFLTLPVLEADGKILLQGEVHSSREIAGLLGIPAVQPHGKKASCAFLPRLKKIAGMLFLFLALGGLVLTSVQAFQKEGKAAALKAPAAPARTTGAELKVFYFHGTRRCMTCNKIEALTMEAMEQNFKKEIESGSVAVQSVNCELPENRHYVGDFNLTYKTVVLAKDGSFKVLDQVWPLSGRPEEFKAYLKAEVEEMLK